jgi:hypothetical protein
MRKVSLAYITLLSLESKRNTSSGMLYVLVSAFQLFMGLTRCISVSVVRSVIKGVVGEGLGAIVWW